MNHRKEIAALHDTAQLIMNQDGRIAELERGMTEAAFILSQKHNDDETAASLLDQFAVRRAKPPKEYLYFVTTNSGETIQSAAIGGAFEAEKNRMVAFMRGLTNHIRKAMPYIHSIAFAAGTAGDGWNELRVYLQDNAQGISPAEAEYQLGLNHFYMFQIVQQPEDGWKEKPQVESFWEHMRNRTYVTFKSITAPEHRMVANMREALNFFNLRLVVIGGAGNLIDCRKQRS